MFSVTVLILLTVSCLSAAPNTNVAYLTYKDVSEVPIISPFIVGGEDAKISDFPFVAALVIEHIEDAALCGGSIIDFQWILTAAHCFYNKQGIFTARAVNIRVGSIYYNMGGDEYYGTLVATIDYEPSRFLNDIALLKVSSEIVLTRQYVGIIGLPNYNSRPAVETIVQIVGYGTTAEGGSLAKQLQTANVSIIDQADCELSYGSLIQNSMVCAGVPKGGIDSCQGDSGGPLVDSNIVVGIVSFGNGCARPHYPGVYTSVGYYRTWIDYVFRRY